MKFRKTEKHNTASTRISKWQIKLLFFIAAFVIVLSALFFTQILVKELIEKEQRTIGFFAKMYQRFSSSAEANIDDLVFINDYIVPALSFPMIITDGNDRIGEGVENYIINIKIDTTLTEAEKHKILDNFLKRMKEDYSPVLIYDSNGKVLQKIYYTHSALIENLKIIPALEIIVIAIFIVLGYLVFSSYRKNEQINVWVGLAKEAAHQLGTPLSSLLAWVEILKYSKDDANSVDDTIKEMETDLDRMNTIARRFSKIGSAPELKKENITDLIEQFCIYYEKRLPHLSKKIDILRDLSPNVYAKANFELFNWVIENLVKNAAESIEDKQGQINITLKDSHKKYIDIVVKDNGKGMTTKQKNQAFNPGFTTKKRGWGLGLSICKRIVEDYHSGKIYIKESIQGKGTTFHIKLLKLVE